MSFSSQRIEMQKQEVKRHLEKQGSLASEYKMKKSKGYQSFVNGTYWS